MIHILCNRIVCLCVIGDIDTYIIFCANASHLVAPFDYCELCDRNYVSVNIEYYGCVGVLNINK